MFAREDQSIKPHEYFRAKDRAYDPTAAALKILRATDIEIDDENYLVSFTLNLKEGSETKFPSFIIRMYDELGFLLYQQKRPILAHVNTQAKPVSKHTFKFEWFPEGLAKIEILPTF